VAEDKEKRDKQVELAEEKYPGPKDFVHLHIHSAFSPLDGIPYPKDYVDECKARGFNALAITDHGSMGGIPDAYLAAKEAKIKFIPGCEVYYNDRHLEFMEKRRQGITVKSIKAVDEQLRDEYVRNRHMTILTKDRAGYGNLIDMMTEAWEIGLYYRPRVWFDQIIKHKEGLIVLSGCLNSPICHYLRNKNVAKALDYVRRFRDAFGDDFFIEVQMPGPDLEDGVNTFLQLMAISKKFKIPAVITGDCHYISREDFQIQKLLMAVEQKLKVDDPNLFHVNSDEQFFKTRAEFRQTFMEQGYANGNVSARDFEEACDNTTLVAQKCEGFKPDTSLKLPVIPDADKELVRLTFIGLKKIGKHEDQTYVDRAKRELKMIIEKGFSSYFLITRDLVDHSRKLGFEIGPGRGSVGGSIVAYLIGITTIDSIRFGLSFERFQSASRGGNLLKVTMT